MQRSFRVALIPVLLMSCVPFAAAQELKSVALPKPRTEGGKPLMEALKARQSTRAFGSEKLSPQMLSDLLWAAFGVNRPGGRRTAPSAHNWQEIDIYVALSEGTYVYNAIANTLEPVAAGDLRAATGGQGFVKDAAANLVYVSDFSRMSGIAENEKLFWTGADAGFIGQNVYLFCASSGLVTVIRGTVDQPLLAKAFKLRPAQHILLAQSVGYPAK